MSRVDRVCLIGGSGFVGRHVADRGKHLRPRLGAQRGAHPPAEHLVVELHAASHAEPAQRIGIEPARAQPGDRAPGVSALGLAEQLVDAPPGLGCVRWRGTCEPVRREHHDLALRTGAQFILPVEHRLRIVQREVDRLAVGLLPGRKEGRHAAHGARLPGLEREPDARPDVIGAQRSGRDQVLEQRRAALRQVATGEPERPRLGEGRGIAGVASLGQRMAVDLGVAVHQTRMFGCEQVPLPAAAEQLQPVGAQLVTRPGIGQPGQRGLYLGGVGVVQPQPQLPVLDPGLQRMAAQPGGRLVEPCRLPEPERLPGCAEFLVLLQHLRRYLGLGCSNGRQRRRQPGHQAGGQRDHGAVVGA